MPGTQYYDFRRPAKFSKEHLRTLEIIFEHYGRLLATTMPLYLYLNHIEQAKLQLTREPRPLPIMKINPDVKSLFDFQYEDFELVGYDPHPHIKAEVSV